MARRRRHRKFSSWSILSFIEVGSQKKIMSNSKHKVKAQKENEVVVAVC